MEKNLRCLIMVFVLWTVPYVILKAQPKTNPTIKITFINMFNQLPIALNTVKYTNCWNETFTISKLKYYISNVSLQTTDKKNNIEKNSYHLINEEDSETRSYSFLINPGNYETISFLIGVDSIKNVSGAQTDALDPLNGMFWTWNTGYIMFKMEGISEQSTSINKKIEYHIGGFTGTYNVLREIKLNLKKYSVSLKKETLTEIIIHADIDKIWNGSNQLTTKQTPVCTTPGVLAASIADNYATAFKIFEVIYR